MILIHKCQKTIFYRFLDICIELQILNLFWFWFIFYLVNELITIIDLKIETNITTLDYGEFDMLIKFHIKQQTKNMMAQTTE